MAACERESPDGDLGGIDARECARELERGFVVALLLSNSYDLPRLATAFAQMAEVEGEHREAGLVEATGEPIGPRLLGDTGPGGHDDASAVGAG